MWGTSRASFCVLRVVSSREPKTTLDSAVHFSVRLGFRQVRASTVVQASKEALKQQAAVQVDWCHEFLPFVFVAPKLSAIRVNVAKLPNLRSSLIKATAPKNSITFVFQCLSPTLGQLHSSGWPRAGCSMNKRREHNMTRIFEYETFFDFARWRTL